MPKYLFAQNVTAEELDEIKSFKKKGSRQFQRGRIIELSNDGWRCPKIAQVIGLSIDRVREWIHRFNQHRVCGLIAKTSTGRPRKFLPEIRDKIRALIGDCPTDYGIGKTRWTLADLALTAKKLNWVKSISLQQIRLFFQQVNWTYTRAKKWQRSPDSQYRRRRNRQRALERWADNNYGIDLIYCDQFWRNLLYLPMNCSYSPRGTTEKIAPNSRISVSTYLAVDRKTRDVHHWYGSYCCTEQTIAWLKPMIRRYANSKLLIIAWDKASWHRSNKLKKFVRRWNSIAKREGKVRLLLHFFPTQSPWLNPAEATIGMIIRYGLQNKTHKTSADFCHSVDTYLSWRNKRNLNLNV